MDGPFARMQCRAAITFHHFGESGGPSRSQPGLIGVTRRAPTDALPGGTALAHRPRGRRRPRRYEGQYGQASPAVN